MLTIPLFFAILTTLLKTNYIKTQTHTRACAHARRRLLISAQFTWLNHTKMGGGGLYDPWLGRLLHNGWAQSFEHVISVCMSDDSLPAFCQRDSGLHELPEIQTIWKWALWWWEVGKVIGSAGTWDTLCDPVWEHQARNDCRLLHPPVIRAETIG